MIHKRKSTTHHHHHQNNSQKKPFHARLRTTSIRENNHGKKASYNIIDGKIRCIAIKILMMKYVSKTKRCAYNAKLCVKMLRRKISYIVCTMLYVNI